jgi:hypothetical protein
MKQLISNDFQKVPDSPRDMDATWKASIAGFKPTLFGAANT